MWTFSCQIPKSQFYIPDESTAFENKIRMIAEIIKGSYFLVLFIVPCALASLCALYSLFTRAVGGRGVIGWECGMGDEVRSGHEFAGKALGLRDLEGSSGSAS